MADDWLGDPFADSDDPAAAAREQRRREREQRRREREGKGAGQEAVAPPPPPPPLESPPARAGKEDFWDEEPAAEEPGAAPTASSPPSRPRRDRGWIVVAVVVAVVLTGAAAAAIAAYQHFDSDPAPPPSAFLKTITLTIPEGYSRAQTAELAREAGLRGDYEKASEGHEGFLFPDTFELEKRAPVSDLVQLQLQDFRRRTAALDLSYARSKNLTLHDVVTIASMVEEEAQLDSERRLIAAVIYNRLREGIPLGIDATIRFATGNYEEPLTESELAVDSPYNTRLNAGLPPGPISSPGLASIEAAARPAQVDYLYYVVEPGACGKHAFSSTDAEFQADVARYNEAREAAGGESPDSCE
ncbi:MAG TPA: endolytic transglycosylase MltG [Solirubrobacterales bacterium]